MSKNTIEDIGMKDLEDMSNEELYILAREEYEEFPKMSRGWKALGALCARIYTQQIQINNLSRNQITDHNIALLNWAKRQLDLGRIALSVENNVLVVIEKKEEDNGKMG